MVGSNKQVVFNDNGVAQGVAEFTFDRDTSTLEVLGDVVTSSDVTLKENIQAINNAMQKVASIQGVTFDWKYTNKSSVGVIAQEVEETLQELVSVSNKGTKTVNYSGLTAVLLNAVKELDVRVSKIESQINN